MRVGWESYLTIKWQQMFRNKSTGVITKLDKKVLVWKSDKIYVLNQFDISVLRNFLFRPERNDMQTGHDEIIALLNQKMADKAR